MYEPMDHYPLIDPRSLAHLFCHGKDCKDCEYLRSPEKCREHRLSQAEKAAENV